VEQLIAEPERLSGVVSFDLPRLGDIAGLRGIHLQCHIGTDTLSLHRLGARMSGLDFSERSISQARSLASRAGAEIEYVVAPVDLALSVLPAASFDLVYTGIGALPWLPDLDAWASIVAQLLASGGRLFLREGHPMLNALESEGLPEPALRYPYFDRPEPMIWDEPATYVSTEHELSASRCAEFSHSLGDVVSSLLAAGLKLTMLQEHDSVPWNALPEFMSQSAEDGEFRLVESPWRLAASYTLQAVKDA
jgi:SAM-dependent methyltransferase